MKAFVGIVLISVVCGFPFKNEIKINPEEIANEFEGDIVLQNAEVSRSGRNGLTDPSKRWPKNVYGQVTVPYKIQGDYCEKFQFNLFISSKAECSCVFL
jgi:hypothetical protein